jgi:hypothetical protein
MTASTRRHPDLDPRAVEYCADGDIPLAKLTPVEREHAVMILVRRGMTYADIAVRVHATRSAVASAAERAAAKETP